MRTLRRTAPLAGVAAIVLVITAACVPLKGAAPGTRQLPYGAAHPLAQQLYDMTNFERAAQGLGPVGWNDQLGGLAQSWSEHMAATGSFSHQDLGAILNSAAFAGFSALGENIISGGCGMSASQMHNAWMSSPSHMANILGNYTAIGIGVACNGSTLYAVEDFGR